MQTIKLKFTEDDILKLVERAEWWDWFYEAKVWTAMSYTSDRPSREKHENEKMEDLKELSNKLLYKRHKNDIL